MMKSYLRFLSRNKLYVAIMAIGLAPAVFFAVRYLEQYAYRMELSPRIFIFTALIIMMISIVAVFGQILSAAKVNPTEVLKKEYNYEKEHPCRICSNDARTGLLCHRT